MAGATTPRAGDLKDRVTFQQRAADTNGDLTGAWTATTTVWAQIQPLRGGQTVMEQRLQGNQPVNIIVRASSATRPLNNTYRAVDARDATRVFRITGADLSLDRAWVEVLAIQEVGQTNG